MAYWLMKSEPDVFGIDDLKKRPGKTTHWDGVRNFQARNFMRDDMRRGDLAFFYHSNCDEPGIAGIVKIVKEGYPDYTAFDKDDPHFDADSDPTKPGPNPNRLWDASVRLTYQATPRNKFSAFADKQYRFQPFRTSSPTQSPEASAATFYPSMYVAQTRWTSSCFIAGRRGGSPSWI